MTSNNEIINHTARKCIQILGVFKTDALQEVFGNTKECYMFFEFLR